MKKLIRLAGILAWSAALLAPVPARAQGDEGWLLEQINGLRASVGVPPYALNAQLSAAAAQHSAYMAETCDVSHTEANGSRPIDRARANGYTGSWISENIYGSSRAQVTDAWAFWTTSTIHYNGLVNTNTNEVGIGAVSGECGNYFTLVFGHRPDVTAPPAPPPPPEPPAPEPGADEGEPEQAVAAAPPPTQAPYVPPPPSRTPTPTIPTLTPSATWTITPTRTPTPTGTVQPATATPLVLPTVAAQGAPSTRVAVAASPTGEPVTVARTPSGTPAAQPVAVAQAAASASAGGRFDIRDLIPFALVGQVALIGIAGLAYFRRGR